MFFIFGEFIICNNEAWLPNILNAEQLLMTSILRALSYYFSNSFMYYLRFFNEQFFVKTTEFQIIHHAQDVSLCYVQNLWQWKATCILSIVLQQQQKLVESVSVSNSFFFLPPVQTYPISCFVFNRKLLGRSNVNLKNSSIVNNYMLLFPLQGIFQCCDFMYQ